MMAKPKNKEMRAVKKALPSILCCRCRMWVESLERDPSTPQFYGSTEKPRAWVCPACRGEVPANPPSFDDVRKAEIKKADRAMTHEVKDQVQTAKRGPLRKVVEHLGGGSATTERGKLECGHECAIPKDADEYRCRKCKPKVTV